MLFLIPVSHVAGESKKNAVNAILEINPGIVALELDRKRFTAMISMGVSKGPRPAPPFHVSEPLASIVTRLIFGAQQWFGKQTGQTPGEEFIQAINAANSIHAHIALIDRDISVTMKRLSRAISIRSVARMIAYSVAGKDAPFDINRIPDSRTVELLLEELKDDFPKLHAALVSERDAFMAARLIRLCDNHPDASIVAVVGAGHVPGMSKRLKTAGASFKVLVD